MLRGIYSHLTYFNKIILLTTLVLSFLLFSSLISILVLVPFYGSDVIGLLSNPDFNDASVITAMKVMQVFNMAGGLLLPALIFMWLSTARTERFTWFSASLNPIIVLLAVALMALIQPVIGWAGDLNSYLSLPQVFSSLEQWMQRAEEQGALITNAFLSTTTTVGLLVNIFMIALLPAFAEEILFRGVLAKIFYKWTKNIHFAVIISSFIFAAIHLQFYGFLPRYLLGMVLGYLFLWSGSLWPSIAAHFTNNFLSVIIGYFYQKGLVKTTPEDFGMNNSAWITAISFISVSGILFYIYRLSLAQRTKS